MENYDYITTYSGVHFYPTHPDPDGIRIEDIAHALSLICRGNGHVKTFFSVGQHCIHCTREAEARGYSDRVILACLLHDASECYMSDVPRPFKKHLNEYLEAEEHLLDVIYEKFLGSRLTEEEARQVKAIDDAMLWYDLRTLLNEPAIDPAPEVKSTFSYEVLPFDEVAETYMKIFTGYAAKLN